MDVRNLVLSHSLLAALIVPSVAQEAPPPDSRAGMIEQLRVERSKQLQPETRENGEEVFLRWRNQPLIHDFLGGNRGFSVSIGNMVPGAGFAVGPRYTSPDYLGGKFRYTLDATASTRRYYQANATGQLPELVDGKMFLSVNTGVMNFAAMPYYGQGPDSEKSGRSNFRHEAFNSGFDLGVRLIRGLSVGALGGYERHNVGPGDDDRFISAHIQFPASVTPGMEQQSSFVRAGAFARYDRREGGTQPVGGGAYSVRHSLLSDRSARRYSHQQTDIDLQQYFSFWNAKRVIALRAATTLTNPNGGNVVPFFLQPTLGGADTMRGFRPFRFYGNNSLLMTAEYRWEAGLGLDMALFADAGKVTQRISQVNFHDLELTLGVGLRAKMRQNLVLRIDTGFSHEGFQVWFRFNNIF